MKVKERLKELHSKREDRKKGINHALLLNGFNKIGYELGGGLIPGCIYGITGDTGSSKTKFCKAILFSVFEAYLLGKNKDFIIFSIALEENERELIDSLIIHTYYRKFGEQIDYYSLNSYRREVINEQVWEKIEQCEEIVQKFLNKIVLIDEDEPKRIFESIVKNINKADFGRVHKKSIEENGEVIQRFTYTSLKPIQVIVVLDHLSLLRTSTITSNDKHKALEEWITDYAKKILTAQLNFISINILQQSFDSAKVNIYNNKNEINPRRVEPALDRIANNKEIARDFYVILGIFNPYSYNIKGYPDEKGYDITILEDAFRGIIIMKHRYGFADVRIGLEFEGNSFFFRELPSAYDKEALADIYQQRERIKLQKINFLK